MCIILLLAAATAVKAAHEPDDTPGQMTKEREAAMGTGSVAHYRIQLVSLCIVFVIFVAFIFAGTDLPKRLCGIRRCVPHKVFLCGRMGLKQANLEREEDFEDTEKPGVDIFDPMKPRPGFARILGSEAQVLERKPLMPAPPQERERSDVGGVARCVFDNPVYRYGGLDAAMEALNNNSADGI